MTRCWCAPHAPELSQAVPTVFQPVTESTAVAILRHSCMGSSDDSGLSGDSGRSGGSTLLQMRFHFAFTFTRRGDSGRSCGCAWLQLRLRLAAVSCDSGWFAVGREKAEASAAAAASASAAAAAAADAIRIIRTLDATNGSVVCVSIEHGNGHYSGRWRHLCAGHSDHAPARCSRNPTHANYNVTEGRNRNRDR